jgi:hypothetical protein
MEAIPSSETSILTTATRRKNPEDVFFVVFYIYPTFLMMDKIQKPSDSECYVPWSEPFNSMKNGVFWVVTPCGSYKNRRFGGTWRLLHQGDQKSVN